MNNIKNAILLRLRKYCIPIAKGSFVHIIFMKKYSTIPTMYMTRQSRVEYVKTMFLFTMLFLSFSEDF